MNKKSLKRLAAFTISCAVVCLLAGRIYAVNANAPVKTVEQVGVGQEISFGGGNTSDKKYLPLGVLTAKVISYDFMSFDEAVSTYPTIKKDFVVPSGMGLENPSLFFKAVVEIRNLSNDPQPLNVRNFYFGTLLWQNAINGPWFVSVNNGRKTSSEIEPHATETLTMIAPIPAQYYQGKNLEDTVKHQSFEMVFSGFPHRASVMLEPKRNAN